MLQNCPAPSDAGQFPSAFVLLELALEHVEQGVHVAFRVVDRLAMAIEVFKPGIGMLLEHFPTTVVPVSIQGSRDALPPGRNLPSFRPVRIIIGKAHTTEELMREGCGETSR